MKNTQIAKQSIYEVVLEHGLLAKFVLYTDIYVAFSY